MLLSNLKCMYVALTGTPGTGKTVCASLLASRGFNVISVKEWAEVHAAASKGGNGAEIDVEKLSRALEETEGTTIVEGHLAHLLPNGICIVLRCHPDVMRERLANRGYTEEKLRENMEAEAIDLILAEAVELCDRVFEVDTTELALAEVADAIESIIKGEGDCFSPGNVDWSQAVLDWY
jgi:adenylate kinase